MKQQRKSAFLPLGWAMVKRGNAQRNVVAPVGCCFAIAKPLSRWSSPAAICCAIPRLLSVLVLHLFNAPVSQHGGRHSHAAVKTLQRSQRLLLILLLFLFCQSVSLGETSLEKARQLLSDPATVRQGISALRWELRGSDQSQSVAAAIMLAEHLRSNGQADEAVKVIEPYGGFDTNKLQEAVLPAYLEYTRCLVADARIREAVKYLDFARENTQGHQHARVLACAADLQGMANRWDDAVSQLKDAIEYGDNYDKRKNISDSVDVKLSAKKSGTEDWKKTHRPELIARLKHAQRQLEIQKYGEGFVDYRDARKLHLDGELQQAMTQYKILAEKHPKTVYAEAAQCYRIHCLASLDRHDQAIKAYEAFIKQNPLGLYRCEALQELGRLQLEQGDVQNAQSTFEQTLQWIQKVRTQSRDLTLYAIPPKAREISAPPEAAQTLDKQFLLHTAEITPSMVMNRQTAPWYLRRLQWDTHYFLGFIDFFNGKHDEALAQFTKAFELNNQLQLKHKTTLGSFHRRLQIACRVQFLLARQEELRAFRKDEKLRFMLADFYALWEKWKQAEAIYREFLNNARSSDGAKACALRALGEAEQHQQNWPEAKRYFKKILAQYPETATAQRAMLSLGQEGSESIEKRIPLLMKAHEHNPNSADGEFALFHIGFVYFAQKKPKESVEAFKRFVRRYPSSRFVKRAKLYIEKQEPL